MREINREIVSALIFSKDGKLFQGKKDLKAGGVYSDCWHIPGGGVDEGETREQALEREIKEETGIDISSYKIVLIDDSGSGRTEKILKNTGEKVICNMKFKVYRINLDDKLAQDIKVSLDDDLKEYIWRDLEDLNKCKITPPSEELFKRLGYL